MSDYKASGKQYTINTIKELGEIVTKDNLTYIIEDLKLTLESLLAFDELNKSVCEIGGVEYKKLELNAFGWIDDGKHELSKVVISAKDNPDTYLEIKQK